MADIPYSEMRGGDGTADGNPTVNLANAARTAVCSVYKNSPWSLLGGRNLPDPTGLGQQFEKFYDHMCADKPLPSPPGRQLPNGQCPGTGYTVNFSYSAYGISTQVGAFNAPGPIGSIEYRTDNSGQFGVGFTYGVAEPKQFFYITNLSAGATGYQKSSLRGDITSIVPFNGPDNCGAGGNSYPITPMPPGGYSPTVPYNDRGNNRSVGIQILPVVIPVGVTVKVEPHIMVKIGAINFNFDLRGASLQFNPTVGPFTIGGGSGGQLNPNEPDYQLPGDTLDPIAIADRFDAVDQALEDVKKCACKSSKPLDVDQVAVNSRTGVITQLPVERNKFMAIAMTTIPVNAKKQLGGDAADVYYAGWAWFSSTQGYLSERLPIDAETKLFPNEGQYPNFHYTLYSGFLGSVFELNTPIQSA